MQYAQLLRTGVCEVGRAGPTAVCGRRFSTQISLQFRQMAPCFCASLSWGRFVPGFLAVAPYRFQGATVTSGEFACSFRTRDGFGYRCAARPQAQAQLLIQLQ